MAFAAPNYTQVPNDFFDQVVPTLKEGELRVLIVMMRQTFGWWKKWDKISLGQLEKKTGMCRDAVNNALRSLIEKGLLEKKQVGPNGAQKTWYSIRVEPVPDDPEEENPDDEYDPNLEDSNNSYRSSKTPPPSRLKRPTKETLTKEKKTVCPTPPVGAPESPKVVKKFGTDGKEEILEKDDVFRYAVQHRKDWSTKEIEEAWEILVKYEGRVNDLMGFIAGTLENIRKKETLEKLRSVDKKEKKSCCAHHGSQEGRAPTKEEIAMAKRPSLIRDWMKETKLK